GVLAGAFWAHTKVPGRAKIVAAILSNEGEARDVFVIMKRIPRLFEPSARDRSKCDRLTGSPKSPQGSPSAGAAYTYRRFYASFVADARTNVGFSLRRARHSGCL